MDDNENEARVLNRTVKHPFLHADAHQCMTEQTRIFPKLPQFLRLVVRWKRASQFINPNYDSVAYHPAYIEPKPPSAPFPLRLLFAVGYRNSHFHFLLICRNSSLLNMLLTGPVTIARIKEVSLHPATVFLLISLPSHWNDSNVLRTEISWK